MRYRAGSRCNDRRPAPIPRGVTTRVAGAGPAGSGNLLRSSVRCNAPAPARIPTRGCRRSPPRPRPGPARPTPPHTTPQGRTNRPFRWRGDGMSGRWGYPGALMPPCHRHEVDQPSHAQPRPAPPRAAPPRAALPRAGSPCPVPARPARPGSPAPARLARPGVRRSSRPAPPQSRPRRSCPTSPHAEPAPRRPTPDPPHATAPGRTNRPTRWSRGVMSGRWWYPGAVMPPSARHDAPGQLPVRRRVASLRRAAAIVPTHGGNDLGTLPTAY